MKKYRLLKDYNTPDCVIHAETILWVSEDRNVFIYEGTPNTGPTFKQYVDISFEDILKYLDDWFEEVFEELEKHGDQWIKISGNPVLFNVPPGYTLTTDYTVLDRPIVTFVRNKTEIDE